MGFTDSCMVERAWIAKEHLREEGGLLHMRRSLYHSNARRILTLEVAEGRGVMVTFQALLHGHPHWVSDEYRRLHLTLFPEHWTEVR